MAQGKERNKEEVLEALKPYFKLGCSVLKACKYAGIPPSTVDTWIQNDDDLRVQVTAWQNEISAKARANWRAKIASGEYIPSIQWLERNEKDDFSIKTESTIQTTPDEHTSSKLEEISNDVATLRKEYEAKMRDLLTKE